ncbi:MAG: hypothetical protein R8K50_07575 [Mariprofundus sp.]
MARQNFKFEKRQKEIAKQKKAEEKRLRKRGELVDGESPDGEEGAPEKVTTVDDWLA